MDTTQTPSPNHFTQVSIKNFKSIEQVVLNPRRINLLIGKPGGGKSNILQALATFSMQIDNLPLDNNQLRLTDAFKTTWKYEWIEEVFRFLDTYQPVEIASNVGIATLNYFPLADLYLFCFNSGRLTLDPTTGEILAGLKLYEPEVFTSAGRFLQDVKDREDLIVSKIDFAKGLVYFAELMGERLPNFQRALLSLYPHPVNTNLSVALMQNPYNIYPNQITPVKRYIYRENQQYHYNGGSRLQAPFGDNLFGVIEREKDTLRTYLSNHLRKDYNLTLVFNKKDKTINIARLEDDSLISLPFSALPDTFRQTLFYIAAAYTNEQAVLLLEDPDVHAFPMNIHEIADAFIETTTNQYFISTHNPYLIIKLLEDVPNEELKVFYVYYQKDKTKVTELADNAITELLELGENIFWNLERFED